MEEIWKDIKGYEGLYQVSNLGSVKGLTRLVNKPSDRMRKTEHNEKRNEKVLIQNALRGYKRIGLSKNSKESKIYVHRLVAIAFIPNPNNYKFINHIDENGLNNNMKNLEWCDAKYNCNYGTRVERIKSKTTNGKCSKKIVQIKNGKIINEFPSITETKRQFGYSTGNISMCCKGKRNTAYGYEWKYL